MTHTIRGLRSRLKWEQVENLEYLHCTIEYTRIGMGTAVEFLQGRVLNFCINNGFLEIDK